MNNKSLLYYESHITIEPVFDERRDMAATICKKYKFRLADLLMKKRTCDTEYRSDKDTFMTGHSQFLDDIKERTISLVENLQKEGFKVWRYKIEDTILDSKFNDSLGLLKQ